MKLKELNEKCGKCKRIKATSLIRRMAVCSKCFDIINKDNYQRVRMGSTIPSNLSVLILV